ncbi:GMC family oxidoreductase N-terminal domain-containing protein [Alkalihalobacillus sp. 1P02AB]|uniref:GMC family oxidoreductase N-terminal domain-containing protein n=1 Tax=Alkalihalobacillus sp. 1P02AB TaxID=3132260 RepID=UPI0039A721C6
MENPDVIVIGAGGGGSVIAKELGEMGIQVLVLEAGPWYGNKNWPNPNQHRGLAQESSDPEDLDSSLYRKQLTRLENDMNSPINGKFRLGPADRRRSPWYRNIPNPGLLWQNAGIGGTTLHYWANSPRAHPHAINKEWPITYDELIPYYEKVEETLPVEYAPMTSKEALFFYGAEKAGFSLNRTLDVMEIGYRPQPNAILPPNKHLMDMNYSLEQLSHMEGCTLSGHCEHGCPYGPSLDKMAKRSTNVSYVPLAMKTGKVTFRPNTFTTEVLTELEPTGHFSAVGVKCRDTWTGEINEIFTKVVVMAAGAIESPRLWLNSNLPYNPWVGRGLTNHYIDTLTGIFDEKTLMQIIGSPTSDPFIGHTSGARLDYPGLGTVQDMGLSPGLLAMMQYGSSQAGYNNHLNSSLWDQKGRLTGSDLKENMDNYRRSLSLLIIADDDIHFQNRVELDPYTEDEHGPVALIHYTPSKTEAKKRNQLTKIGRVLLQKAGARKIHRNDIAANFYIHPKSTMRMGKVVDSSCEAYQVNRLYIADNSVQANAIGGTNPTLTTQALATRTAKLLANKYF